MGYGKCREVMDKKKDRGSAKVINFCLTADTLVLTNNGEKYIKDVQDSDLLWDGESWVYHKGVIKYDNKHTISYAGLTATPDHLVWTTRGVVTLLEAAIRGSALIKTAEAGVPVSYTGASYIHKSYKSKQRQQAKAVCASRMPSLWKGILEEFRKLGTRERDTMSLSCAQEIQNDSVRCFQTIRAALQLHDTKMLHWLTQTISRLQRKGYQSMLLVEGGVYNLGIQRISRGGLCGERVRSHRQQWRLLENESSTCDEFDKPFKYTESLSLASASGEVYGATPERSIQTSHIEEFNAARIVRQGDFRAFIALLQRLQAEDKILQSCIQNDVYDIIDAGKHHRFTANGYLVSNSSSYGGQPASLARQVEIQTGVQIPIDEAKTLLEAVGRRQPRAEEFFKEMEEIPRTTGLVRAASGRLRHCHTFSKDVTGVSSRTKEGWLAALGRECRNYLLQESVGASAARACYWMVDFALKGAKEYGLRGYPFVCLYDSIVVHCPEEERFLWAKALELFMYKKNGWVYGDDNRILRYAIDTELNAGWSTAPSAEQKANLHNEAYAPLPDRLKPLLQKLEAELAVYTEMPELSVYNHWDFK